MVETPTEDERKTSTVKMIWEKRTQRKRKRGRPKVTWDNMLHKMLMKRRKTSGMEGKRLAQKDTTGGSLWRKGFKLKGKKKTFSAGNFNSRSILKSR